MEHAESVRFAHFANDRCVFFHAEIGIAAVSRVDEDFEEGLADGFVGCFDEVPGFGDVGECLEFDAAEKFEVPGLDAAAEDFGFCANAQWSFTN